MSNNNKQRVQFSEAEASYMIDLLRDHMRNNNNGSEWTDEESKMMDMNINIRMKLLKGITRMEDRK